MAISHKRSLTFSDKEDDILSNLSTADNKLIIEQHNDMHKDIKSIYIKRKHVSSSHKPKPHDRQFIQDRIKMVSWWLMNKCVESMMGVLINLTQLDVCLNQLVSSKLLLLSIWSGDQLLVFNPQVEGYIIYCSNL